MEEKVLKLIQEKKGQCTKTDVTRKRITENSRSAQSLLQSMVNRGLLVEETLAAPGRGGHQETIYKNRFNELCAVCNSLEQNCRVKAWLKLTN